MIRIGLLGASGIAPLAMVAPVAKREDCEIVCVAARSADKARAFADTHGIPDAVEGYEALIARDDIDLVYNGLMNDRHADLSIAAVEAGVAVLCEKPFAMNAGEAERMVAAAQGAGRPLLEGFHYRYHPAFAAFADAVEEAGSVKRWEGRFIVGIPETSTRYVPSLGGGALMDLGCYPLHAIRTLTGAEPHVVDADAIQTDTGVDRRMEATLLFGGTSATIAFDIGSEERIMDLAAETDGGRVTYEMFVHPYIGHRIAVEGDVVSEGPTQMTTFDHQLSHVVDVLEGRAEPLTGGADAVANMRAIDAIYRAAGMEPHGN